MTRRSLNWNEGLANDLRDPNFAREFIVASIDEGLSLQATLGKVIRAYGILEFSKQIKMASPNLLRALNPRHNPTQETLNRLLRPFKLHLTVGLIDEKIKRKKA